METTGTARTDRSIPSVRVVRHDGFTGCGSRVPCPMHGLPWGPHYRPAEKLRGGRIIAHDCGRTFHVGQPLDEPIGATR